MRHRRAARCRRRWGRLSEGVTFRTPREVLRFLCRHEWMDWSPKERLGRRAAAETVPDRFALRNYRRGRLTEDDAGAALHWNGEHA